MRAQDKSVLISGIGIAGPTLAHWLLRFGFQPTLVEHAPHLRTGGYVIDLWGLGYDVAEIMDLLPALQRAGYQVEELRLVDDHGRRVGGFSVDVLWKMMGGRYLSIPRGDMASLIYGKIDGHCETLFGDSIISIEQCDMGARVKFEHAPARKFDLLIGAGGLHSPVRSLVFGSQLLLSKGRLTGLNVHAAPHVRYY